MVSWKRALLTFTGGACEAIETPGKAHNMASKKQQRQGYDKLGKAANVAQTVMRERLKRLTRETWEMPEGFSPGDPEQKRLQRAYNEMTPVDRREMKEDPLCMIPEWFYDC